MNNVLVTGGTSGLGRAIATEFLSQGNTVWIHGRNPNGVGALLKKPKCHFIGLDLLKAGAADRLVLLMKREKIECYVSCAGVYSDAGTAIPKKLCRDLLTTNLVAPILILTQLYEHYKAERRGTIVSINSLAGLNSNFGEAVYCASKYGLRGFIKALQMDAHRHNVRILDYYPGAIQTRMTRKREGFDTFIKAAELAELIVGNVTSTRSFVPVTQELRRTPTTP